MDKMTKLLLAAAALASLSVPALAGWKIVPANRAVLFDAVTLTPTSDWNRASARPGKFGVALTHDGFGLDGLEIFSGVPAGAPLYRERSAKKDPMPKFEGTMLLTDLADFFERSFRVRNQLTDFTVEKVAPVEFGGHKGVMLRYRYSMPQDGLVRQGIARLAIAKGKLYAANFYAPRLHYFPAYAPEVEAILDSAAF